MIAVDAELWPVLRRLRRYLDVFDDAGHVYLSTACHHGRHSYCQSRTRPDGARKRPSTCKFCDARCVCECHPTEGPPVKTIEIQTVWLIKATAHNGNGLQVVVQLADGTHHVAIEEVADDGPISHAVSPSGILASPIRYEDQL